MAEHGEALFRLGSAVHRNGLALWRAVQQWDGLAERCYGKAEQSRGWNQATV